MQVMPMQPLLLHRHPLQLCRLSMHGLQLVGSRHLGNRALKLSWIRSSYLKSTKNDQNGQLGLRNAVRAGQGEALNTNQTVGGATSRDREEDRRVEGLGSGLRGTGSGPDVGLLPVGPPEDVGLNLDEELDQ